MSLNAQRLGSHVSQSLCDIKNDLLCLLDVGGALTYKQYKKHEFQKFVQTIVENR